MSVEKTQKFSGIIPEHVHHTRLTTYAEYQRIINIIVSDGGYNLSFIIGKKGNGKTSAFEKILEKYEIAVPEPRDGDNKEQDDSDENKVVEKEADQDAVAEVQDNDAPIAYLNNAASGVGMYEWAYDNREKKVLILDDVRKLFKDEDAVTLLMALCNTKSPKRVHWRKHNKRLENNGVPMSFTTSSRMVIISNTIDGIIERLEPLLDRGRTFLFDPSTEELHHNWAKGWADREVWTFIDRNLDECPSPSGRWYFHAAEEKRVNPTGWKKNLLDLWRSTDPERALFLEVQNDLTLTTEGQRVETFKRLGRQRGLPASRPTYFRWKTDYPHLLRPLPKRTTTATDVTPTNRSEQVQIEAVVESSSNEVLEPTHSDKTTRSKNMPPARKVVAFDKEGA